MKKKIIARILFSFLTIFIIITLTFWVMHLIPGGPFDLEKSLSFSIKYNLEKKFHLNKPIFIQYFYYIKQVLCGDLGISLKSGREISTIIIEAIKPTLFIGIISLFLSVFLGVILGLISATQNNKFLDKIITLISNFFISIPNFVLSTIIIYIFCLKLNWFPVWSLNTSYILPILALTIYPTAKIIKLTKSTVLQELSANYVTFLKIYNISKKSILYKHVLKNSLTIILSYIGPLAVGIFTGNYAVETVFGIGGLGKIFINSINVRDYPVIMAVTIITSILLIIITLITDILYIIIDPRISNEEGE